MGCIVNGSEIILTGYVGDLFWGEFFSHSDVIKALAKIGDTTDIVVRMNSPGGVAADGAAIHAAFANHKGKVTMIAEGYVASSAFTIYQAGDERIVALGATLMVHEASGFTFGTIADHKAQIKALTALNASMAEIYAKASERTTEECLSDMRAETWMTGDEAVKLGYADSAGGEAANDNQPMAFDYRLYKHAPEALKALAVERGWTVRPRVIAGDPASQQKEETMPKPNAPGTATDLNAGPLEVVAPAANAPVDQTMVTRAVAADISRLCTEGGVPALASALIAEGATIEKAKERIASSGQIKNLVAMARQRNQSIEANAADDYIAKGNSVEQVRADLFDKVVAAGQSTEITNTIAPNTEEKPKIGALASDMRRRCGLSTAA